MNSTSIWKLLALALGAAAMQSASAELRIRRNINDIGKEGRQLYVDAVTELKKKKIPKPTEGNGADNLYDIYVNLHDIDCMHSMSEFLPWHRKMLCEFEDDVRSLGGKFSTFTTPYWDWTTTMFPSDLDTPGDNNFMGPDGDVGTDQVTKGPFKKGDWATFLPGPTSGTKDLERRFHADIGDLKTKGAVTFADAMTRTKYTEMRSLVEAGPGMHNSAHFWVGGQVSDPSSGGDDPIFFLLHCFTDLAWTNCQFKQGQIGKYDPAGDINDDLPGFGDKDNGFKTRKHNKIKDWLSPLTAPDCNFTYHYGGAVLLPEPGTYVAFGLPLLYLLRKKRK